MSQQFSSSSVETKPQSTVKPKLSRGNATVRVTAHRLRSFKTRGKDPGPKLEKCKQLPFSLLQKAILPYDTEVHDLRSEIKRILRTDCAADIIGGWKDEESFEKGLEYITVLEKALRTGRTKSSQSSLSDITKDIQFLEVFDNFVQSFILQYLKRCLIESGEIAGAHIETTFYYQFPPTLRIQPGPSLQNVGKHRDSDYGHQDGEINFWIPLTDRYLTQTDLHVESAPGKNDFTPLDVNVGQAAAFHGTSLSHYVPPNATAFTRVSLDFRVGITGYFDSKWTMGSTLEDVTRKKVVI